MNAPTDIASTDAPAWNYAQERLRTCGRVISLAPNKIAAFVDLADGLASDVRQGFLDSQEVADRLHEVADAYGLIAEHGHDAVQRAIADGLQRAEPLNEAWQEPTTDVATPASNRNANAVDRLVYERVADVPAVPVDWIWQGRLARRKLTLDAGDPGVGKSQLACDTAARVSTGADWPDFGSAPIGSVIILSAEDSVGDTLRPRLEAAGADLKRVHALKAAITAGGRVRSFSLQSDLALLGEKVTQLGDVVMIIVDPITSYMGKIDSHRTTDVRAVLEPLADFADRHNIAVLAVTHPPKATQAKALHAITGSLAFVAAARLVFIVVDEAETERRLLLAVKNNLGAMAAGLGFSIAPIDIGGSIHTSRIVWDSTPVTITANQALWAAAEDAKNQDARGDAKEFIREAIAGGAVPAATVEREAKKAGISARTLRRARKDIGVRIRKDGYQGEWLWEMP